jgi:Asp-tRNA(Asn)/Glu-tRNA(Gln) amidotransferase C subunit
MGDGPVVDRWEVERIARLAHVTLDDQEKTTLASEMGANPKRAQELLRAKLG